MDAQTVALVNHLADARYIRCYLDLYTSRLIPSYFMLKPIRVQPLSNEVFVTV